MRTIQLRSCGLALFVFWGLQSLADVALQEAERRRQLDQQGIEGKVIEGNAVPSSSEGNITTSKDTRPVAPKTPADATASKGKASARSFRAALQKLDRTIRENEHRLELRRARQQSQRWETPKTGRVSRRRSKADSQNDMQKEIEELQVKLQRLRRERAEVYEEGIKAGFLPGELDGKSLDP